MLAFFGDMRAEENIFHNGKRYRVTRDAGGQIDFMSDDEGLHYN